MSGGQNLVIPLRKQLKSACMCLTLSCVFAYIECFVHYKKKLYWTLVLFHKLQDGPCFRFHAIRWFHKLSKTRTSSIFPLYGPCLVEAHKLYTLITSHSNADHVAQKKPIIQPDESAFETRFCILVIAKYRTENCRGFSFGKKIDSGLHQP